MSPSKSIGQLGKNLQKSIRRSNTSTEKNRLKAGIGFKGSGSRSRYLTPLATF